MVKSPKGVFFGPVVNGRAGHSKASFKYDEEDRVKKVRQYILKDIINWEKISRFSELDCQTKLEKATRRTFEKLSPSREYANTPIQDLLSIKMLGRVEEETIRVIDKIMAERAREILEKSYILQDISQVEDKEQPEGEWQVKEDEEEIRERIVCNGNKILLRTHKKTLLRIPPMTSKEIIECIDAILNDSEDEVSENETIRRKMVKGEKKVELQGMSLKDLGEKLNME